MIRNGNSPDGQRPAAAIRFSARVACEDLHMTWWKVALLAWLGAMALMLWFLHRSKRIHG